MTIIKEYKKSFGYIGKHDMVTLHECSGELKATAMTNQYYITMIKPEQIQALQRYSIDWHDELEVEDGNGQYVLFDDVMRLLDPNYERQELPPKETKKRRGKRVDTNSVNVYASYQDND